MRWKLALLSVPVAMGLAAAFGGRAEAGLIPGSTVFGTFTAVNGSQYFLSTTATVDGAGFSGNLYFIPELPVSAVFTTDTLTVTVSNISLTSFAFGNFGFKMLFTGLQVDGGGVLTGLAARAGGTFPYASATIEGNSITVKLDDTFSLDLQTTYTTTFDITTAVPEPAALASALSAVALVGLGYAWRKRRPFRKAGG